MVSSPGIVAGSASLTLPKQATELDDGLLTASEAAQPKLKADWVVLSACDLAVARCRSAVRAGARFLLCWRAGASRLALSGRFRGHQPARHFDVRRPEDRSEAWLRRRPAHGDAGADERQRETAERLRAAR
jgi:hypothetical protein